MKKEGLILCSELRLQIKYGSKTKEVGSFCDAFGIKRIKSPSAYRKKVKKYSKKIRYKNPKENEPTKLIDKYPNINVMKKETTKDLQTEINTLKVQVKQLQQEIIELKTKTPKYINVITKKEDKEFLLDIIEKIEDPIAKKEYLERLKSLIIQEDKMPKIIEPFSISKLIDK